MKLDELLKKIKDRADKATSGPWAAYKPGKIRTDVGCSEFRVYKIMDPCDANFIAHARTDVPRLIEVIEYAEATIASILLKEKDIYLAKQISEAYQSQKAKILQGAKDEQG